MKARDNYLENRNLKGKLQASEDMLEYGEQLKDEAVNAAAGWTIGKALKGTFMAFGAIWRGRKAAKIVPKTVDAAAEAAAEATGQLHHPVSKKIFEALENHKNISKAFKDNYRKFVTRATDPNAHKGYQEWHRKMDADLANWLEKYPDATEADLIKKMTEIYADPDVAKRFPTFVADFTNWLNSLTKPATIKPK